MSQGNYTILSRVTCLHTGGCVTNFTTMYQRTRQYGLSMGQMGYFTLSRGQRIYPCARAKKVVQGKFLCSGDIIL